MGQARKKWSRSTEMLCVQLLLGSMHADLGMICSGYICILDATASCRIEHIQIYVAVEALITLIQVRKLSDDEIRAIMQMTHPGELDLGTRKRLNESMRRRFESPEGLRSVMCEDPTPVRKTFLVVCL